MWEHVVEVLTYPSIFARALETHREDGGLQRELEALEKRIADNARKQSNLALQIADADDAAPLMTLLNALAAGKRELMSQRDTLERRIADSAADRERVKSLTEWAEHFRVKLDGADYATKRLALEALGVNVKVYRPGSVDEDGNAHPRWELTMRPAGSESALSYASIRRECRDCDRDVRRMGCLFRCGRSARSRCG